MQHVLWMQIFVYMYTSPPPVQSHLILPTKECDYPSWLCQPNCGISQEKQSVVKGILNSFFQPVFKKCLVCVRHYANCWAYRDEKMKEKNTHLLLMNSESSRDGHCTHVYVCTKSTQSLGGIRRSVEVGQPNLVKYISVSSVIGFKPSITWR